MRLIDADEIIGKIHTDKAPGMMIEALYALDLAENLIDHAPTVDSVMHGHWEETSRILEKQTESGFFQGRCSECHRYSYQTIGWGGDMDLEYCPHCGAKMEAN